MLAGRGHPPPVRQHRHVTSPVVHFVKPKRHERQPPRRGDDAVDADGLILITPGVPAQIGDVGTPPGECTPADRRGKRSNQNEAQTASHEIPRPESQNLEPRTRTPNRRTKNENPEPRTPTRTRWATPNRGTTTGCGDASACLKLRTPLIRRDPRPVTSNRVPGVIAENPPEIASRDRRRPDSETPADLTPERFAGSVGDPDRTAFDFEGFRVDFRRADPLLFRPSRGISKEHSMRS